MKCKKCGKEFHNEEKYCSNCGTSILGDAVNNSQSKSNNYLIIVIVVLLFVVFTLFVGNNTKRKIEEKRHTGNVVLKDMVFNYDNTLWVEDVDSYNAKNIILKHNDSKIQFTYYQDIDGNIESYIDSLIEAHQNNNYTILSSPNKSVINNLEWRIVKYQNGNQICLELLYGYDFDIYVLTYMANNSVYDSEVEMFKEIYNTLRYNIPDRFQTEIAAQNEVIGEWDLGNMGYYVITPKLFYYFKDRNKNLSDVQSGTYIAKKTRCRGVENGYPTDEYVDCVRLDVKFSIGTYKVRSSSINNFEFIPTKNGNYYISAFNGPSSGEAVKVK